MQILPLYYGIWLIPLFFVEFATAQENLVLPTETMLSAGVAGASSSIPSIGTADPFSTGISEKKIFEVLSHVPKNEGRTRGAHEIALFKNISPSVALISTNDAIGSGSVISDGLILTNWHVVSDAQYVAVLYKPETANVAAQIGAVAARVIKVDQVRDLALLKPNSIPSAAKPIELGNLKDLQVGADVHAIGHPKGESWSYTKGIVSQIRTNFTWSSGDHIEHQATVIQTQTPINSGNSGGPLLTDDGRLVGVNSFYDPKAQGLNFAVSVTDVRSFLAAPSSVVALRNGPDKKVAATECESKVLFEGRNKADNGVIRQISLKCDKFADFVLILPDDKTAPMMAFLDTRRRSKADIIIFDPSRSANWKFSYWDVEFNDTFPLKGIHSNGGMKPVRFEKRCPGIPAKNFRCM